MAATVLRLGDRSPRPSGPPVVCHALRPGVPLLAREEFTPIDSERVKLVAVSAWGDFVADWSDRFSAWSPVPR